MATVLEIAEMCRSVKFRSVYSWALFSRTLLLKLTVAYSSMEQMEQLLTPDYPRPIL